MFHPPVWISAVWLCLVSVHAYLPPVTVVRVQLCSTCLVKLPQGEVIVESVFVTKVLDAETFQSHADEVLAVVVLKRISVTGYPIERKFVVTVKLSMLS
jgi:hypothetical protein